MTSLLTVGEISLLPEQRPIIKGTVALSKQLEVAPLSKWSEKDHTFSLELFHETLNNWKKSGVTDYLLLGKASKSDNFKWNLVPYKNPTSKIFYRIQKAWQQIKMLLRTLFKPPIASDKKIKFAKDLWSGKKIKWKGTSRPLSKKNPFTDKAVIKRQKIFESKHHYLLYNYKPLTHGDFLIVSKNDDVKLEDLSTDSYLEVMKIANAVSNVFLKQKKKSSVFLTSSNGSVAGQTVPRWHMHVSVTPTKKNEFLGKLNVLKKIIFPTFSLKSKELSKRVKFYSDLFAKSSEIQSIRV